MGINDVIAQEVLKKGYYSARSTYNYYLSVRPLVLSNTLSHIWDRLNLPILLFKEGLLPNTFPLLRLTFNTFHTQFQLVLNTSKLFSFQLPLGLTLFLTS